jgi:hypothetical protein
MQLTLTAFHPTSPYQHQLRLRASAACCLLLVTFNLLLLSLGITNIRSETCSSSETHPRAVSRGAPPAADLLALKAKQHP